MSGARTGVSAITHETQGHPAAAGHLKIEAEPNREKMDELKCVIESLLVIVKK